MNELMKKYMGPPPTIKEIRVMKKKCYVLIVSEYFPAHHPKAGQPTGFIEKIRTAILHQQNKEKIHTIRENFDLWEKRIKEVQAGNAYISLRAWAGKPYKSIQIEFAQLTDVGIEKMEIERINDRWHSLTFDGKWARPELNITEVLPKNDGLSLREFCDWFKDYDLTKPLAVIHFTDFRYAP